MQAEHPRRPSRREREAARHRAEILDAARRLFVSRGYDGTSLQQIATEAEFSIGTLYNFFGSKQDLYFAVIEREMSDLVSLVQRLVSSEKGAARRLEAFARGHFAFVSERKDAVVAFWHEIGGFSWGRKRELERRLPDWRFPLRRLLRQILEEAWAEGVVGDSQVEEQTALFWSMCRGYLRWWHETGEEMDLVSLAPRVVDRFLRGFGR